MELQRPLLSQNLGEMPSPSGGAAVYDDFDDDEADEDDTYNYSK
jgi:hypothetical protein